MNIKQCIKNHGWTISAVAQQMKNGQGISQSSLSQMLSGNPTLSNLQEIANIIGISLSELVSDSPNNEPSNICPHCGKPITITVSK